MVVLWISIGLLIGIATGVLQFYMLKKFTGAVSLGKITNKTVIFAITQFLFPFAVLVICAFLIRDHLMWVGIGIAAALVIGAILWFVIFSKKSNEKDPKSSKGGKSGKNTNSSIKKNTNNKSNKKKKKK